MAYKGETYGIDLAAGGYSYDKNIDKMPIEAMVEPTKNINLHEGGRGKRGGTATVNTSALSGTPRIYGLYQYTLQNGNTFIITATSDGRIQKDYTTVLKTGLTINRAVHFVTFNNLLIICTGNDLPQVWDGTDAATYPLTGLTDNDIEFTAGVKSTQTITFTGDPSNDEIITVNGKSITFKTSATDETTQVELQAGTATEMAAEFVANMNDSARGSSNTEINVATYSNVSGVVTVTYDTTGTDGNAFTLAESATNLAVGGATLTGGINAVITKDTTTNFITRLNYDATNPGFTAGQIIKVDGSTSNDGDYTIKTVAAGSLTLTQGAVLATEDITEVIIITSGTPSDWNSTNTNYPRKLVTHGKGASERLWAVYGKSKPQKIYASAQNVADGITEPDFSDANVLTFNIDTGDGTGIVNAVEYGDRLVCASRNQTYIIEDTDTNTDNWGYNRSQWEGGTASDRLFVAVTNDIISMDSQGTIYSVTAAQSYGDYKKASLTRTVKGAPFMDEFIRNKVKLSAISDFHAVYDPVLRCINFFVVRTGQSDVDTALCYFIDRGPENGWVIKDNVNSDSGFKASSSAQVEVGGLSKIYTGGWDDGFVWSLESTNLNDNSAAYDSGFRTPRSHLSDPRLLKRFDSGRILIDATGNYSLYIDVWVDGEYLAQNAISLAGLGSTYGGGDTYGTHAGEGWYGGGRGANRGNVVEVVFPIGRVGKRIEMHVFNNNADEDYFASQILIDFKPLARQVA